MNIKYLFSLCLILAALICVGCTSAADVQNATLSDKATQGVDQQNDSNVINDQIVKTEKTVQEVVSNGIETINEKKEILIPKDDINSTKNTSETINNNSTRNTSKEDIQNENDDAEEIHPGNGYTVELVKQINHYVQYYKDRNYNLRELFAIVAKEAFPTKMHDYQSFTEVMKAVCVIHNQAMLERGYGTFYTITEIMQKGMYYACCSFFESLA